MQGNALVAVAQKKPAMAAGYCGAVTSGFGGAAGLGGTRPRFWEEAGEGRPPRSLQIAWRSGLNDARNSAVKAAGCSQAAKWPPLSSLL